MSDPTPPMNTTSSPTTPAADKRRRAVIVDDSRAMRTILSRIVGGLGFQTTAAADGREAFALLDEAAPPDLLVTDWNMPEVTGYELVRMVRARPAFATVKIVMVTTETELSQISAAMDAGADEYVMKPFTADIMLDKLRMLGLAEEAS